MVCEALLTRPVKLILPTSPAKVFQSGSWSVPVELLPYFNLTIPPAFQKYLAASALANVTVCVNVMVQADVPDPVAEVLLVVPENTPYSVPEAAAFPRLLVMVLMSVDTLAKIEMVLPATGCVLDVKVELVCDPAVDRLDTKVAHCVAVTVPPADTVEMFVCPHPLSPVPVPQTLLMLLAPVLTKPL
jgi:hypothetical protein